MQEGSKQVLRFGGARYFRTRVFLASSVSLAVGLRAFESLVRSSSFFPPLLKTTRSILFLLSRFFGHVGALTLLDQCLSMYRRIFIAKSFPVILKITRVLSIIGQKSVDKRLKNIEEKKSGRFLRICEISISANSSLYRKFESFRKCRLYSVSATDVTE